MAPRPTRGLGELARLYGIQTAYVDVRKRRRHASPEALLRVLRALGAPVEGPADVPSALRERRRTLWDRLIEPVAVAWDGAGPRLELHRRAAAAETGLCCELRLEHGEVRRWTPSGLPQLGEAEVDGERFIASRLDVPGTVPWGYHTLVVEAGGERGEALVIAAPRAAYAPAAAARPDRASRLAGRRGPCAGRAGEWGVFLPLYALRSDRNLGIGDLGDLEALSLWAGGLGGRVVATLPLLATFLDEPFDPSPYSPVSRLFWNELYVDATRAPELEACAAARARLGSPAFRQQVEAFRRAEFVDYAAQMALKREVLEELARCFFAGGAAGSDAFRRYLEANPRVDDYARFRAACERRRAPWPEWPAGPRDGRLEPTDYDDEARRYHLYVQWLADRQLETVTHRAGEAGVGLYLDLPLGVHPAGYDAWRERELFVAGVSGGAPPDPFFAEGQDWGFRPLHPERIRRHGYRYTIAALKNHLRYANVLRIDHVMSLHRLFWVPAGLEPRHGVYIRYHAPEQYAILSLESHRHRSPIVGEDLGTVPRAVRRAMARHGIHRMHVVQFELVPDEREPLPPAPRASVAGLNTHDMPPFAAFWEGLDIEDRREAGLLDPAAARRMREERARIRRALVRFLTREGLLAGRATTTAVLRACLAQLAAGRARLLLINLEDLWLESRPQNMPGRRFEHLNWRRKARLGLDELRRRPEVLEPLGVIDRLRRNGRGPHGG